MDCVYPYRRKDSREIGAVVIGSVACVLLACSMIFPVSVPAAELAPLPEGVRGIDDISISEITPEELWIHGNLYIDNPDDPRVIDVCSAIDVFAYNLNRILDEPSPEKAVSLAKRTSLRHCTIKELVLAEFLYAPGGETPDPGRYRNAVEKTAAYTLEYGGVYEFPIGRMEQPPEDAEAYFYETHIRPMEELNKELQQEGLPTLAARSEMHLQFLHDVTRAYEHIASVLRSADQCEKLKQGLAYWTGTAQYGVDREYAEIFIRAAYSYSGRRSFEETSPDVEYIYAKLGPHFTLFPQPDHISANDMTLAALGGHPDAAIEYGMHLIEEGDASEAQSYLLVAALNGNQEAAYLLTRSIEDVGDLLSEEDKGFARSMAENYPVTTCRLQHEIARALRGLGDPVNRP